MSPRSNGQKSQRVEEAAARLKDGVSQIVDGEEFRRYLSVAARFHNYSPNNCLFIWTNPWRQGQLGCRCRQDA